MGLPHTVVCTSGTIRSEVVNRSLERTSIVGQFLHGGRIVSKRSDGDAVMLSWVVHFVIQLIGFVDEAVCGVLKRVKTSGGFPCIELNAVRIIRRGLRVYSLSIKFPVKSNTLYLLILIIN